MGTLENKDYQCIDTISFITGYVGWITGYKNEPRFTDTSTFYSELIFDLCPDWRLSGFKDEQKGCLRKVTRV